MAERTTIETTSTVERCDTCGFDGATWTEATAMAELERLPERWIAAVNGVGTAELAARPFPTMWSIGEYVDHVREVLFGMRFVLDIAIDAPGTDLGAPPEPEFAAQPNPVDVPAALEQLSNEARQLLARLAELDDDEWQATVRFDDEDHDAGWICRHAVHDATHHLGDVERLKTALAH